MIKRYEALILAVPEITQDEAKNLENGLDSLLRTAKGSMISFERWGKYKLYYPIRKNDYGVYYLTRFEIPEEKINLLEDVKTLFAVKLHEIVMRTMVSALSPKQPLVYQRPKSLEEASSPRDNSFFKDHRMEGFIPGVEENSREEAAE